MANKKIFLVGDFETDTGPAIANKALKKALGSRVKYCRARTKIGRVWEVFIAAAKSDVVCFCGFSELNVYGIKFVKIFGKKSAYLMHGFNELEARINHEETKPKRKAAESFILDNVDVVICVSELLAKKVKERYPKLDKVYVVYNIVEKPKDKNNGVVKDGMQVMSTGGGMLRKNNLVVCEAIKKLNSGLPKDRKLKYVIAGKAYGAEKEFRKYDFVDYVGEITHEETLELMQESGLYVQNSVFDTFGLAVIEAAGCGCKLIISEDIGAREVIKHIDKDELIEDVNDVDEIARKIKNVVFYDKAYRDFVDWGKISDDNVRRKFLEVLETV